MALTNFLREFDPYRSLPYQNRILATSLESTNDLGKLIARSALGARLDSRPWLLVALEQSKGKGRLGNDWQSPLGGIYVSIVLPTFPTANLLSLPLLTGIGLCRSLETMLSTPCKLKWPNDVLACDRKIGGILIETVARNNETCHAVVGFGVNYESAPQSERYPTTSVRLQSTDPPALPAATRSLVSAVTEELTRSHDLPYAVDRFEKVSVHTIGEQMTCRTSDGTVSGSFLGFDSRGFLRLESDQSEVVVSGAELVSPAWETRG